MQEVTIESLMEELNKVKVGLLTPNLSIEQQVAYNNQLDKINTLMRLIEMEKRLNSLSKK